MRDDAARISRVVLRKSTMASKASGRQARLEPADQRQHRIAGQTRGRRDVGGIGTHVRAF